MIRSTNWVNIPHYEIRKWIKSTSDKVRLSEGRDWRPNSHPSLQAPEVLSFTVSEVSENLSVVFQYFYRSLKKNLRWRNQQSKMKSFATVEREDEHKMLPCLFLNLDLGKYLIETTGLIL